jgi:tetratricopeptide (TPR) repeat protein
MMGIGMRVRGTVILRVAISILFLPVTPLWTGLLHAATPEYERARELYHRTAYRESLAVLLSTTVAGPFSGQSSRNSDRGLKDAATLQLIGQNYFMLAEYKKATEWLEKAAAMEPENAQLLNWLGRAYGRRAETSNPFTAPGYASKARQMFEKSVAIDPGNKEATGDLLDFYLDAPGFMGGGTEKAEALVKVIARVDPAEGHYAQAMIDERRKQYDAAEEQLRRAAEIAPRQVGRVMALAKYLAKRGRIDESEAMFERAARMAPGDPRILFERASTYVQEQRNLGQAREMLERYLRSPLTAEDPPREQAAALLKKIG